VGTTRHSCYLRIDPFDAVAQCVWMLSVPYYALPLAALQLNGVLDLFPTRQRRVDRVWTAHGVADQEV
jgi:hypothetical protein